MTAEKNTAVLRTTGLCFSALILWSFAMPAESTIFWNNSSGQADWFDWSLGGSDNGLFGDPQLMGTNILLFHPQNFRAESANNIADVTADRLQVRITAHQGYEITKIKITEYGDYGIMADGSVSVTGTMFVSDLNSFDIFYDELASAPASPITSGSGRWSALVKTENINCTDIMLILDNNLMATGSDGNLSFIEKKIIGIEIIPEPATIAILAGGSFIAFGKNKKGR